MVDLIVNIDLEIMTTQFGEISIGTKFSIPTTNEEFEEFIKLTDDFAKSLNDERFEDFVQGATVWCFI